LNLIYRVAVHDQLVREVTLRGCRYAARYIVLNYSNRLEMDAAYLRTSLLIDGNPSKQLAYGGPTDVMRTKEGFYEIIEIGVWSLTQAQGRLTPWLQHISTSDHRHRLRRIRISQTHECTSLCRRHPPEASECHFAMKVTASAWVMSSNHNGKLFRSTREVQKMKGAVRVGGIARLRQPNKTPGRQGDSYADWQSGTSGKTLTPGKKSGLAAKAIIESICIAPD
jgi:hypothetical protein